MRSAPPPLSPDYAASMLIQRGAPIAAIADDAGLALALFVALPRPDVRTSQIPTDFDAVRASYAAIMAGQSPLDLSA